MLISNFFYGLETPAPKTIENIRTNLSAFWEWLVDSREIRPDDIPKFPRIIYDLGWRKTISKEVQNAILEKIKKQTARSPRFYIAFLFLCTYMAIRPGERLGILEEHVNLETGHIVVRQHKTRRKTKAPRVIPLLPEDIKLIEALPRGFPKMPFFRHDASIKGMPPNTPFGNRILRKVWNRASKSLEIEGVDLYGGTRHSTQQFYKQFMSAEDCQRLSVHTTSKAGLRDLELQRPELVSGYFLARSKGTPMVHRKRNVSSINPSE